jgi:hypothetical protein
MIPFVASAHIEIKLAIQNAHCAAHQRMADGSAREKAAVAGKAAKAAKAPDSRGAEGGMSETNDVPRCMSKL